jgi:hypothetical protein
LVLDRFGRSMELCSSSYSRCFCASFSPWQYWAWSRFPLAARDVICSPPRAKTSCPGCVKRPVRLWRPHVKRLARRWTPHVTRWPTSPHPRTTEPTRGRGGTLAVVVDCSRVALVEQARPAGVGDRSPSPSCANRLLADCLASSGPTRPGRWIWRGDAAKSPTRSCPCSSPARHAHVPGRRRPPCETPRDRTAGADLAAAGPLGNGMLAISGRLDPEVGADLAGALDPLSAPVPATHMGDERPEVAALSPRCRRRPQRPSCLGGRRAVAPPSWGVSRIWENRQL